MRPEQLYIEGFGPFPTAQHVDFSRFDEFMLITGPTGSGKTTIFDAVMFALYGRVPGTRNPGSLVSDLLQDGSEPCVEMVFSVSGERFKVKRIPPYIRKSKRSSAKQVEVPTSVSLFRLEEGQWLPVTGTATEINTAITDRIRLTAEEFSRIVLLPQGEFQKFLVAETTEKHSLLKKIFPANEHEELMRLTRERNNEKRALLKQKNEDLKRLRSGFDPDTCDERLKALEGSLAGAEKEYKKSRKALEKISADIAMAGALLQYFDEDDSLTKASALLEQEEESVRDTEVRLALAKQAQAFRSPLDALENRKREIAQEEALALQKTEALKRETARHETLKKEALRVPALDAELSSARAEMEKLKILLPKEKELQGKNSLLEKTGAALKIHDGKISAASTLFENNDGKIKALKTETAKIQELNAEINSTVSDMSAERELLSLLERYEAALKRKTTAEQELKKLRAAETGARRSLEINSKQEEELKNRKDSSLAASLAAMLQPGTACPVCGSTEHPEPAILKGSPFTEEDLLRTASENVAASRETLARNLEAQNGFEEQIRQVMKETEKLDIPAGRTSLEIKKSITSLQNRKTGLDKSLASLKTAAEGLQKLEDGQEKIRRSLEAEHSTRSALLAEHSALEKEISLIRTDLDGRTGISENISMLEKTVREKTARIEELNSAVAKSSETLEGLRQSSATVAERLAHLKEGSARAVKALQERLAKTPFASIEECRKNLLEENEISGMEKIISTHNDRKKEVKVKLETVRKKISGKERPDMAALSGEHKKQEGLCEELETRKGEISTEIRETQQRRDSFNGLMNEIDFLMKETETLASLASDLNGNNPKNINFQNFILGTYLCEVTDFATERLLRMTEGRYRLMVNEEIIHGAKQTGLELDVFDSFSGQQRSVRSLSGGEKFLASISLSLGLADAIQSRSGAIELDAIFIDEGFGSLDEEALDRALSILDEIRGNRMVGIISHVAELKNRIPSQIRVVRGGNGSRIEG